MFLVIKSKLSNFWCLGPDDLFFFLPQRGSTMTKEGILSLQQLLIQCEMAYTRLEITAFPWLIFFLKIKKQETISGASAVSHLQPERAPFLFFCQLVRYLALKLTCNFCVRFPKGLNEAPSDVNTTLDGSTYPGWKMCHFSQANFFSWWSLIVEVGANWPFISLLELLSDRLGCSGLNWTSSSVVVGLKPLIESGHI